MGMMNSNRDIGGHLRDDLCSAFALLTRLPLPDHAPRGADAAWAWPLVGAALGALAAVVAWGLAAIGLTPGVAAALGLVTLAVLTGGLHEDGLADTSDGFFGGRSVERRLEIMKDSHIGSFGTLALILVTLARWSALTTLCASGSPFWALIVAGAMSRASMVVLMAAVPPARPGGLSHAVGRPTRDTALIACGLAAAIGLILAGWPALWLAVALAILTAAMAVLATHKIGGQTGDVLGATQQLCDLACLALLAGYVTA
jgi:adenosylcobinamide-GDP ribazoletransferase